MGKLKSLANYVKAARENSVADMFINDLIHSMELESKNTHIPTQTFKPSGIGGCTRGLYYQLKGESPDGDSSTYNMIGIGESGTDRHERLQNYVKRMKKNGINCKWVNVGTYLRRHKVTDPEVVEKKGNETKLYSHKYNMRFMCDGLIQYNGEYYIIEIKTESTHKFNRHQEPWPSHKLQATCYSMTIGVPKVIFIYEDRDNCTKKGYLVEVTEPMIERVESIINTVNWYVEQNQVPPMAEEPSKCMYCNYKNQCRKDG